MASCDVPSRGEPEAPSQRAAGRGRHASVDALRAIACLAVVTYHMGLWWMEAAWYGWPAVLAEGGPLARAVFGPARLGFLGVSLFLVLSGFCLYAPLVSPSAPRGASPPLGRFFLRRAVRTLPAYWASILVVLAASRVPSLARVVFHPATARDVWTHALMVHNLFPDTIWTINGVYWTLALEWQLYLAFPLAVLVVRRAGLRTLLPLSFALSVGWMVALRASPALAAAQGGAYGVWYESLPARFFEFAAGMGVAAHVRRGTRAPRALLAVVGVAWVPVAWWVHVVDVWAFPIDRVACGASFAALLWLAIDAGALARGRAGRALAWLGGISYSLYLVHQPILLVLAPLVARLAPGGPARTALAIVAGMPLVVAAAWAFHRAFEAPALAWLAARRSAPAALREGAPPPADAAPAT